MIATTENKKVIPAQLEKEFQALIGKTFASEPDWLKKKREEAFERFCEQGIPGRKNEEYKYTDVRKVFAGNFSAVHNELHSLALEIDKISVDKNSVKLVFVNGWLYKDSTLGAALPKGVIIGSMANDGLLLHSNLLEN